MPRRGRAWLGALGAAVLLASSCSDSRASARSAQQVATFETSLKTALDEIAAMGYSRNSIQSASDDATFALPKGVQYIGAQYVSRSPTDIIFVELVLSNSEATLERARDAALAAAKRDGFRSPVSDGHRFRFDAPLRPSAATQKDWLGWIVPGTALVVVNRYAHAPVTENARSLLDKLAAP